MDIKDVMVIGGGPAGLSAAINVRRRNKSVVLISKEAISSKLWQAPRVENYLGLADISGEDLAERMRKHALEQGVAFVRDEVQSLWSDEGRFSGMGREAQYSSHVVILAVGVMQEAGIDGEQQLVGKGVSYCATCDGMFYRGKQVAMISQIPEGEEEARFLAELCERVFYLPQYPLKQVVDPRIEIIKGKPLEIIGEGKVTGLRLKDTILEVDGVFIERPSVPMTKLLPDLAMDDGAIKVDREMRTNLPGVFAAGDCIGRPWQISKAVGEGQVAALSAVKYMETLTLKV
jgi:thioredoxin reductase (NADPH)